MPSHKEQRIRNLTQIYYSKPEVQKAIFEFCKNREICPRYFEGFGKRPDSFQYTGDIFELVKKGATSFHCSEEIWNDPLKIITGMTEEQANRCPLLLTKLGHQDYVDSKFKRSADEVAEIINKTFELGKQKMPIDEHFVLIKDRF